MTYFPPQVPRYTHPDYQRTYGHALALTDAAEAIVLQVGDRYMELAERWAATGEPFTREDDVRLFAVIQQAGQLAAQFVDAPGVGHAGAQPDLPVNGRPLGQLPDPPRLVAPQVG